MNYSKRHELPIVTIVILILNLIGLITDTLNPDDHVA